MKRLSPFVLFAVVTVMASFAGGFLSARIYGHAFVVEGVTNIAEGQAAGVDFSLFWDAWRLVQDKYADAGTLDYEQMVYGSIKGMVESLDDPYTIFLKPQEAKQFLDDISGFFEGVGMEIGMRSDTLTVIAPLEGTPADQAGLKAGDKIISINGKSAQDMSVEEAVSLIRGQKGTIVKLSVFRDDWKEEKEFEITRDVINIPSVTWKIREDKVAYVKIHQFSEKSRIQFQQAAKEILSSDANRLIIDVRNDPGGFLEVAVDIAGWFVRKGDVVVVEDFGSDEKNREYLSKGNAAFADYPLVVLMNKGSASASEILAGALRDQTGAKLIGEQSFGKGSVQELIHLGDGSAVKVTVAKWLTPKGDHITGKGLTPDVQMENDDADDQKTDSQLEKALEIVKQM